MKIKTYQSVSCKKITLDYFSVENLYLKPKIKGCVRECVRNLDLRVQVHPGELWFSKQWVHIALEASKSAGAKGDVSKICGFVHPLKRIPCYLMRNAKIPQTRIIPLIFIVDKKSDVICFARQIVSCILPKLMIMLHYHEF